MAEQATLQIKEARKFITRFQKLSFGGDAQEEIQSQHSQFSEKGLLISEMRLDEFGHEELHSYQYDSQGRLTEHHMTADDGMISESNRTEHDDKGRVIRQQKFYADDPGEYTEYIYSAHEHPVMVRRFDADGEPESEESIEYNKQDLPVEVNKNSISEGSTSKTTIEYNEQSLPVKRVIYDGSGKIQTGTEFHYDDKGQLIRVTEKNGDGKVLSDTQSEYDENGNVTERRIRDFQSRILRFAWDDHNNCIEESVHDEHANLLQRSTYEFDEFNRPVSESHFHMDVNRGSGPANNSCRYEYINW